MRQPGKCLLITSHVVSVFLLDVHWRRATGYQPLPPGAWPADFASPDGVPPEPAADAARTFIREDGAA